MISSIPHRESSTRAGAASSAARYCGKVVYIYAFDIAYEMARLPVTKLLGHPVTQFSVDAGKRSPKQLFFYRPQMVCLPPMERIGPRGPLRLERVIKLLPVGAVSITVSVPFEAARIEELVAYHDLQFDNGALHQEVRQLAEALRRELSPFLVRPITQLADEEAYTVFCLESPFRTKEGTVPGAEDWLRANRREVASLLTQEPDINHLSKQEAEESTGLHLSYYENDLVVIDWDAALIMDEPQDFAETLYIMELANLQLAELEAYDRILDDALERSYRDLRDRPLRRRGDVLRELREIRVDLARLSDELSNITKFFGDWHLARIYEHISTRFHLADWHRTIDEKLKTLDNLYQLLQHDQTNRWMLLLEVTIVVLFVVDLVLLFMGLR